MIIKDFNKLLIKKNINKIKNMKKLIQKKILI
jgi:hypothetical protein